MLSTLHIQTTVKTLNTFSLISGMPVIEEAYRNLSHHDRLLWVSNLTETFHQMEDEIGLLPSQAENAKNLLRRIGVQATGQFFPWHIVALDGIYNRYIGKLSAEYIEPKLESTIRKKIEKELSDVKLCGLDTQLLLLLKLGLDKYVEKQQITVHKNETFERLLKSKRKVSILDISELTIAMDAIKALFEGGEELLGLLYRYMSLCREMLLYYQARIDYVDLGVIDAYWAVSQIKHLSVIKMYFIDKDSGKKNFYADGFRQDHLDSLLSKLLSTNSLEDIQKMAIDEKLDYLYTSIESALKLGSSTDRIPQLVKKESVNSKFLALIILSNLNKKLKEQQIEWVEEFSKLIESLIRKYTTHTFTRARDIQKPFDSKKNAIYYHRYLDECIECVEIT